MVINRNVGAVCEILPFRAFLTLSEPFWAGEILHIWTCLDTHTCSRIGGGLGNFTNAISQYSSTVSSYRSRVEEFTLKIRIPRGEYFGLLRRRRKKIFIFDVHFLAYDRLNLAYDRLNLAYDKLSLAYDKSKSVANNKSHVHGHLVVGQTFVVGQGTCLQCLLVNRPGAFIGREGRLLTTCHNFEGRLLEGGGRLLEGGDY